MLLKISCLLKEIDKLKQKNKQTCCYIQPHYILKVLLSKVYYSTVTILTISKLKSSFENKSLDSISVRDSKSFILKNSTFWLTGKDSDNLWLSGDIQYILKVQQFKQNMRFKIYYFTLRGLFYWRQLKNTQRRFS